jgi:site-specific recombinase XerD
MEGSHPDQLSLEEFGVEKITEFLQNLETSRNDRTSTRNVRLSATHSFSRYLGAQFPEHLEHVQRVLGIPFKRTKTREIEHFDFDEIQALLKTAEIHQSNGCRDSELLRLSLIRTVESAKSLV